jgi:Hypervirulence associated proteins TUDOR domain
MTDKSDSFQPEDRVKWESSQGTIEGKIEAKLTEPTEIKHHKVAASTDDPQYLVKSDKTGKEAAHKPESLQKIDE